MKFNITSLFLILTFAVSAIEAPVVSAVELEASSVAIDTLVLSRCGTQMAYTSGTATYGEGAEYLRVTLDGTEVIATSDKPALWVSGLIEVSPGVHTVSAVLATDASLESILASDTKSFTVPACDTAKADADEKDCCPGPDPATPDQNSDKKGKVAGATTVKAIVPTTVKGAFQIVFGKMPTECELNYWNGRYATYKKSIAALMNTMKWYKMRGKTMPSSFHCEGTKKMRGEVFNISETEIEVLVQIEPIKTLKFKLTKSTYMPKPVTRGSAVEVTFNGRSREAVSVKNLSPNGQVGYFGGVDCISCGL